jgi:hypothetical protein
MCENRVHFMAFEDVVEGIYLKVLSSHSKVVGYRIEL